MQKVNDRQNTLKSWQNFIDTLSEDVVIVNKAYKIVMANTAAKEQFGYKKISTNQIDCKAFFKTICNNCNECPVKKTFRQNETSISQKRSSPETIYEIHTQKINITLDQEENWIICTGKQILPHNQQESLILHNYLYIISEKLAQAASPTKGFKNILSSVNEVLGVNLCGFLHVGADNKLYVEAALINNTFHDNKNHLAPQFEHLPKFTELLQKSNLIHLPEVNNTKIPFKKELTNENIHSFLAYPLKQGENLKGAFILGYAQNYHWPDIKINFVKTIGSMVLQNFLQQENREKLRRLNENFINIFENSSDAVFIVELNGQIIEVNHTAEVLTNYSKQELIQKNVSDISKAENPDLSQMPFEMLQSHQMIFGTDLMPRQGDPIPVETREKLIRYEDKLRIVVIARDVRHRRELNHMMVQTISETQDKERQRIAEGLHDDVGPLLSTLRIYIDLIKNEQLSAPEFDEYSDKMNEIINQAIDGVREVSRNLMPGVLNDFGLIEAINDFCKKINQTGIIRINFDYDTKTYNLEDQNKNIIFSVIKELINNSIKHANASEIKIKISISNQKLKVRFTDNGKGLKIENQLHQSNSGLGIKNLMSKINSVEGKVKAINCDGFGIEFLFPYAKPIQNN